MKSMIFRPRITRDTLIFAIGILLLAALWHWGPHPQAVQALFPATP